MNFELNETQLEVQKLVREFSEKELSKDILKRDESAEFPMDLYRKMVRWA